MVGALAAAGVGSMLGLLPASAAEPDEVQLASDVRSVVIDDLDEDGVREVIAIVPREREPTTVEAWSGAGGTWRSMGVVTIPIVGVEGRERASVHQDGIGLLAVRDGDRTETLLFLAPDADVTSPAGMSIHQVGLETGRLVLRPVGAGHAWAEQVLPLDVDGDGRDELVAIKGTGFEVRRTSLRLLRRTASGWLDRPMALPDLPTDLYFAGVGDTDGRPGSELFIQGGPEGATWRVAFADDDTVQVDRLRVEGAAADAWPADGLWLTGAAGGRAVVQGPGTEVALLDWPRGSGARVERSLALPNGLGAAPLIIGTGADERVVLTESSGLGHGPFVVMDAGLDREEARLDADPVTDTVAEMLARGQWTSDLSRLYPFTGPVPYGFDGGRPAVWLSGWIAWVDADGRLQTDRTRPLLGATVMGSAGPDEAWLVLGAPWPLWGNVYLRPGWVTEGGGLVVALRETVIGDAARAADGGIAVDRLDGHEVRDPEGMARIASDEDGFEVRVTGPDASVVVLETGSRVQVMRLTERPLDVTVKPPGSRSRDQTYRATMIVVAPSGIVRHEAWDALIVREGPQITADATTVEGELAAVVRGQVEQTGGEVLVDGEPVAVASDGSFEARVDAPPWPQGVDVLARDVLGTEARVRVDVIGLVDYRGWPWPAIVAALTIGAGGLLFWRIPRGDRAAPARTDDGELEEILGD